jgi:DNA-binding NarL/FixJ family response regulator
VSPDTAAVVISADEFDPLVRQLMIAGAMTYVRKGIAPADLAEVLHRALRARPLSAAA